MTLQDEIREQITLAQQALTDARMLLAGGRIYEMNTELNRAQRHCYEASIVFSELVDLAG